MITQLISIIALLHVTIALRPLTNKVTQYNVTQPNGSVFTRVGTIYTGLAYGHIVMRYNLTSISWRARNLEELNVHFQNLIGPKEATISDRYFLKWSKMWVQRLVKDTSDEVEEAIGVLTRDGIRSDSGSNLTPHISTPRRRQKRQILAITAGATIGTIAGSIISHFSSSSVNDVLENKQGVLVSTVQDNLVRLNQEKKDIENLKKSLDYLFTDQSRYIKDARRNTYGITHLQTVVTVQQNSRTLREAMNTLESARIGEFHPSMVDHEGLVKALKNLRSRSVRHGYEPSAETSVDLRNLPCTTVVRNDMVHLIIHVPLYRTASNLDLFRYVDHPTQRLDHNLYASIDMEGLASFVAINRDESKYKEFTADELEACYHQNKRYFCPNLALYSKQRPHCLWALYLNNGEHVREYCRVSMTKMAIRAVRVDENHWMITDTGSPDITTACNDEVPSRDTLNGTKLIEIKKGCRANTNHVTIDHPAYEPEVDINGLIVHDAILFEKWLKPEEKKDFTQSAREILDRVGKKIPWQQVATVTAFKAQLAKAQLTLPTFSLGSITDWFTHAFAPVLSVLIMIFVLYLMIKCGLPTCIKLCRNHRERRAQRQINRRLSPSHFSFDALSKGDHLKLGDLTKEDEEEPMEIDRYEPAPPELHGTIPHEHGEHRDY